MTEAKKLPALLEAGTGAEASLNGTPEATKWQAVLAALCSGSLNRFEAERTCFDHCLNSTIPIIEARGVHVERQWELVPCKGGSKSVRVLRYWAKKTPENLAKARHLLGETANAS